MTAKSDDLEAVRVLAATLEPFKGDERERIIRWAREKLGMSSTINATPAIQRPAADATPTDIVTKPATPISATDIKSFVAQKDPKSDVHFAATVAYFHEFVVPEDQRQDSITRKDIVEACRQVDRRRPNHPAQVMVNAYHDGLFDRGARGHYKLNSVGENLVAMALPGNAETKGARKKAGSGHRKGNSKNKGRRKVRR